MKVVLAGGHDHLNFTSLGPVLELPEVELGLSFGLLEGTIHIKLIDFDNVLRSNYWPRDVNGQAVFFLPSHEPGTFVVHGESIRGRSRFKEDVLPVIHQSNANSGIIEIGDTSNESECSESDRSVSSSELSRRSRERSPQSPMPRSTVPGKRALQLDDFPIERIDDFPPLSPHSTPTDAGFKDSSHSRDLPALVTEAGRVQSTDAPDDTVPEEDCPTQEVQADTFTTGPLPGDRTAPSSQPRSRACEAERTETSYPGILSILPIMVNLSDLGCTGEFASLPFGDFPRTECRYLPSVYDGNHIFEVLPVGGDETVATDVSFDGHPWVKSNSYNSKIIENAGLRVRKSFCAGAFECRNKGCSHLSLHHCPNTLYWDGRCQAKPLAGDTPLEKDWRCSFCRCPPVCIHQCASVLWNVTHESEAYTRAVVHAGQHCHESAPGRS